MIAKLQEKQINLESISDTHNTSQMKAQEGPQHGKEKPAQEKVQECFWSTRRSRV